MFSKVELKYTNVPYNLAMEVKKLAKNYHGKVKSKTGHAGDSVTIDIIFRDKFPEYFATTDSNNFILQFKDTSLKMYRDCNRELLK